MRTPQSEIVAGFLGGVLFKGGTPEGAARGWETRRGRAAVEPEIAGPRARGAEEKPAGRRGAAKIDVGWIPKPAGAEPSGGAGVKIGLDWLPVEGPKLERPPGPAQKSVRARVEMMRRAAQDPGGNITDKRLADAQGVGETYRVTFADGTQAAYKPTAGTALEKMRHDVGTSYNVDISEAVREMGIYALSEDAGFNVVPHIEIGDFGDGDGHAMAWVDGRMGGQLTHAELKSDVDKGHPDIHRIAVLDLITGNGDRHGGNYMLGEDGRYYAIDNGFAFPKAVMGPGGMARKVEGKPIPAEVAEGVRRLQPERVRERMLGAGLGEDEARAAVKRLEVVSAVVDKGRWPSFSVLREQFAQARGR